MAYSYNEVLGTGAPQLIPVPEYIDQAHIRVRVAGVETQDFTWTNPNTISITAPAGQKVRVFRRSSPEDRLVDYLDGMSLTEAVLDTDSKQAFFLAQEQLDNTDEAVEAIGSLPDTLALIDQKVQTAANEADAAAASAVAAATSATQADQLGAAQVTLATQQANNAAASATSAQSSATSASTSATNSLNSANAAASSAASAASSAAAASGSATAAFNSANDSATSATASANSASAAATSATQAAASAAAAAASAGSLNSGGWSTSVDVDGRLEFRYNGSLKLRLSPTGELLAAGDMGGNQPI